MRIGAYLPLIAMALVLALCGWLVAGMPGVVMAVAMLASVSIAAPQLSPAAAMRFLSAVPIDPSHTPNLHRTVTQLAGQAGLESVPALYQLRGRLPNAVALGDRRRAAIALSAGIVSLLDRRELAGVLAHEIAHIAANDIGLMRLGELIRHITSFVCRLGLIYALYLLFFVPGAAVPLWIIVILAAAPWALGLLQLAFSRRREFAADAAAVGYTGDPLSLAAALGKLEAVNRWTMRTALGRASGVDLPGYLRTHPATKERVEELQRLVQS